MLIKILLIGLLLFVAFCFGAYVMQERLIFFPQKLPRDYQFNFPGNWKEVNFHTAEKVEINALHFKVENPKGLILYFHGNAGSLLSWGGVAGDFVTLGYDVLVVDYRGYGKSTGSIKSEADLHQDAEYIYTQMKEEYREDGIVVYGRSIGTGVAAKLAAVNSPRSLVLESPYYSLASLASHHYPWLPVRWLLRYQLENSSYLKLVRCPVYLIHGTNDGIIPYNNSRRLEKLGKGIKLYSIEGGGHNNLSGFPDYEKALKEILLIAAEG